MKLLAHCKAPGYGQTLQAKTVLVMKLTALFLLIGTLSLSARTFSQKVTLSATDMPMSKLFSTLEKQTGYTFVYDHELIAHARPISIHVKDVPVTEVLRVCLEERGLVFDLKYDIIVVKKAGAEGRIEVSAPPADSIYVFRGQVVNENGEPLSGVSVGVKDANTGATTNGQGEFEIKTTRGPGVVLVFSYVGYQSQETRVHAGRRLEIKMAAANKALDNFVVVGYGSTRQKDLTGSVATVGAKDLNQGAVLSPQAAIQGKIAGVNIAQNSGKPGGSNTIRIRGGTSLTASNEPLYVIDGVPISTSPGVKNANIRETGTDVFDEEPTNPLMTINPDDIESVTVLKDASAAAIYGARGANGVIVITTKKGSVGKSKVSLSVTEGMSKRAKTLPMLSGNAYRDEVKSLGLTLDDKGANTNWQDKIYRTGVSQDYYLSFSGGSDKTSYKVSLGHGNQKGIMLASDMSRNNVRININQKALNDRLTFDLRANYGEIGNQQAPISNTVGSESGTSMNYAAYVFNPTYPVYDSTGGYWFIQPYGVNPVSFSTDVIDKVNNTRFLGNLNTSLKILEPLSIHLNLGYTRQGIDRNSYIKKSNLLGSGLGGYASVQKLQDYSKLLETYVRYNPKFGKHSLEALAGYSYQYFLEQSDRTSASGFLSDDFLWYSLQAAKTISTAATSYSSNTIISMYGRLNYNYDDRFLATATVRRDGSSRFGVGNKWGIFPSGSLAWRISEEKWLKTPAISDLKLRASYGITGNQEIGNLNSISTLGASTTGYVVGGQRITIVLLQQYANPDLKWEQTAQFNTGVDFGLFNQRLHGTLDYYDKKTTNLLLSVPVPSPTIVSTQLVNVGSVSNRGIELQLGGTPVLGKDLKWDVNLVFARNRNKVLSLSNNQYKGNNIQVAPLQGQGLSGIYAQLIVPGQPIGTFWGKQFVGLKDGVEQYAGNDTVIGNAQPKFTYGISNTLSYKNFDLTVNLRGSVGNKVFNLTANNLGYLSNLPGRNVLKSAVTSGVPISQPKKYSSRWIEDGSFLRCDNVTLGYNLHLKMALLSNARVFVSGQNLFLITKYKGLDPEVNSEISGTGVAPLGIDYLAYPKARGISAGINLNF